MVKKNKTSDLVEKELNQGEKYLAEKVPAERIKANNFSIKNLPPQVTEKDYLFESGNGFGLRVRTSGKKIFYYKYRFKGKLRFMNLGTYPSTSYADANKKYGTSFDLRQNGLDPIEVEKEAERKKLAEESKQKTSNMTVSKLIELYIEEYSKRNKKTWHKDELVLKQVEEKWGKLQAIDITKLDLIDFTKEYVNKGLNGQAQNILEAVRAMYNWAVIDGYLSATPFIKVRRPSKKKKGSRVLSESEIKQLWTDIDTSAMTVFVKRALKLTLVTAQRSGECISIHREEINGNWWTIPGEKTKNEKPHRVYLTSLAIELIGTLEYIDFETGETKPQKYIFPCPNKKKNEPMRQAAMGSALRKNYAANPPKITISKFIPHDLRRTAITNLARLKIPKEWRERIANHLPEELDATYNLYEYDEEKENSMLIWETDLKRILNLPIIAR